MSPLSQRIALAELDGFQWYWRYDSWNTTENRANWRAMLTYPDQEGIGSAAWIGTVNETRHMTPQEIEAAKRGPMRTINQFGYTDGFATYAPDYLNDLNALWRIEEKHVFTKSGTIISHYYQLLKTRCDPLLGTHMEHVHANGTERSWALLNLLNKWHDTK